MAKNQAVRLGALLAKRMAWEKIHSKAPSPAPKRSAGKAEPRHDSTAAHLLVPPPPKFATLHPGSSSATPEAARPAKRIRIPWPELRIVAIGLIAGGVIGGTGWFTVHGTLPLNWNAIPRNVPRATEARVMNDDDLPYITSMPLGAPSRQLGDLSRPALGRSGHTGRVALE